MNIIDELKKRDVFYDATSVDKILQLKGKGVYIGFDPTAISLHLGNYIQIVNLLRFQKAGYKTFAIIGGATAMIGDPSGKQSERVLLSEEDININKKKITMQLKKFNIEVIDNYDFYKNMNILDFLRHVGKLLNVNYMISKNIVKSRLDDGISFTEFSYQLIQGWDFYQLNKQNDICVQIGGSDQWGNITAGLEIIRKKMGNKTVVAGLTTKLLTSSSGEKFGKTNNNKDSLWLDSKLTSSFKIYQYFLNRPDSDVEKLLNWLTFLPTKTIDALMKEHKKIPHLKIAQKKLTECVTSDLRGKQELENAINSSNLLFGKITNKLTHDNDLVKVINDIPNIHAKEILIMDALVSSKLAVSKREAREFITNNSISINGNKITDVNFLIVPTETNKKYSLIKCGKQKNALIVFGR